MPGRLRPLLAVIRATLLQSLRERTPLVALLVLFALIPLLAATVEGDGTLLGQLRTITTYVFMLLSAALMLLMLYLSATTIDIEIQGRQIHLVDVKPVPRWQILLGKWIALVLLAAWIILVAGCILYGALQIVAYSGGRGVAREGLLDARQQFLTARASFRPELPDIDEEVAAYRARLEASGRIDPQAWTPEELEEHLRQVLQKGTVSIRPGLSASFPLENLPPGGGDRPRITVRYRLIGRSETGTVSLLAHRWYLTSPDSPIRHGSGIQRSKSFSKNEFHVDSTAVGAEGELTIMIENLNGQIPGTSESELVIPLADGIEVLVPTGSFEANFIRALILLWIRMAMIAAVGVGAGALLSGSVTALLLLLVLAFGLLSGSLVTQLDPRRGPGTRERMVQIARARASGESEAVAEARWKAQRGLRRALAAGLRLVPDFTETNPVPDLAVGREIPAARLLRTGVFDILLRGGVFLVGGTLLFYRRELGLPRL